MTASTARLTQPLRVLVVGLGSIGRRHLRVARDLFADAEFAALRSRTSPVATDDPSLTVLYSLRDALAFAPGIAVIASPASHHAELAMALAAAGVHLLIEKPLTDDVETAVAVRDAVTGAGVTAAVGYNLRHLESLVHLRDAVHAGATGRVLRVHAEVGQFLPDWRPGADYRTAVSAQQALGGGALLELSHELDYLLWIFGEVASVTATLSRQSDLEIDTEDTAHLLLRFTPRGGAPGVIASVSLDFVRRDVVRRCSVVGTDGTLEWDGVQGTLRRYDAAARESHLVFDAPVDRDATYRAEWIDLCACIAAGATPRADLEAGVAVLRVIDAARRSSASQCTVALAPATHSAMTGA